MDHLPLPDNVDDHLIVPYLEGIPYDNQGFLGYDIRAGWDVQRLRQGKILDARQDWDDYHRVALGSHADARYLADGNPFETMIGSFIQNWFIYGIFQVVLKRPIHREEAVLERSDLNGVHFKCLTTKALFQEFTSRAHELAATYKDWMATVSDCLKRCAWILEDLDTWIDDMDEILVPGPTYLALASLVQTMDEYNALWFGVENYPLTAHMSRARWLEQHVTSDLEWCPARKSRIHADVGISGLYYASIIPKTGREADHTACTGSMCLAYNVSDNAAYLQCHQNAFCRCDVPGCLHDDPKSCPCRMSCIENIGNIGERIRHVVLEGGVPLISTDRSNGSVSLKITPFKAGLNYVAISHVWSDGMGNPLQNMILSCQAEYLQQCTCEVLGLLQEGEAAHFWLDTLCVPLTPDSARWAAIEGMHRIYSNATTVLVLAEELMTCALPSSIDEIVMRIVQCKWMTRLWTMQEGILARNLMFQFRGKAIPYSYLMKWHNQSLKRIPQVSHRPAHKGYDTISSRLSFESNPNNTPADRLRSFWWSMRHRTTSRLSDQAICAGILCGLDLSRILAAPSDQKMAVLWQEFKQVPLSMLWLTGPRMQTDSMRWAPSTLLDPHTWAVPPKNTTSVARVSEEGGLYFSGVEALALPGLKRPTSNDRFVAIQVPPEMGTYHILIVQDPGNPQWDELEAHWSNVALLWDKEAQPIIEFFPGVLVSVVTEERDYASLISDTDFGGREERPIHANWLTQVTILSQGENWREMVANFPAAGSETDNSVSDMLDPASYSAETLVIPATRHWCIS
ncbi:hypothetical protein AYL99_05417 [Fonsecaea erecta]|uniref:Heterokaryon incompatibility domain-containing protein n=1 Tax=Fonsecaea erecta TaxID=1367422 RepID=A0A178ZN19_9EURO|nr:hypothetical protein AYL99_05417 [Fonsecaea erecta]OAP60415.1 hypothetical protein AYL99_05417 [Fonsecaea erecta]